MLYALDKHSLGAKPCNLLSLTEIFELIKFFELITHIFHNINQTILKRPLICTTDSTYAFPNPTQSPTARPPTHSFIEETLFYKLLMKNIHIITLITLILICLPHAQAATGSMAVSTSIKYVNSGKITVSTSSSYNLAVPLAWSPSTFSYTYPSGLQGQNSYTVIIGLMSMRIVPSSNRTQFYQTTSTNSTSFTLNIYSSMAHCIQRLVYRYLILSNSYAVSSNLLVLTSLWWTPNTNLVQATAYTATMSVSPTMNATGTNYAVCFLNGMDVTSTSLSTLSVFITATVLSSSSVSLSLRSTTATATFVTSVRFDFVEFNNGYYNKPNYATFYTGTIQGSTGTISMAYTNTNNCNVATIFSLSGFAIQSDAFLDFSFDFGTGNSGNSLTITTANTNNALRSFSVAYITMLTYYCSTTTPYFYSSSSVCYDVCPARSYTDASTLSCFICAYDCYTCDNTGNCLTCNPSDYRYLNSTRCVPMNGYFENQTTVCPACASNCLLCLNLTYCTNCSTGSYLSSGICYVCPTGCTTCISNTQCQSCTTGYILASNSMCYNGCNSTRYLNITTSSCQSCPNGCTSCVSSTSCTNCPSGTYLSAGICQNCPTTCLTCLSSSYCYNCRPGYYLRSDQLCYTTCLARTYPDSLMNCLSCPYDCLSCNSTGSCLSCSATTDHRILNTTTNRCVAMNGYYDSQTAVCSSCPLSCQTCLSATLCTICVQGYYLSNGNCVACPSGCLSCLSSSYCVGCKSAYFLNSSNLCSTTCASGFYAQTSTLTCNQCSSVCLTCSASANCTSCNPGSYLSSQTCQICSATCATCNSSSSCITCAAGYYKNSSNVCIAQCPSGQYLNSTTQACSSCSSICLSCSNFSTCTSCYPNYYYINNSCYTCGINLVLKPDLTCSSVCPARYFADPLFRTCQPCPYDCYTCDSTGKCLTCNETTDYRVLNTQTGRCLPKVGYFDSSGTNSSTCPNNCQLCSSASSCSSCTAGYFLNNGQCNSCPRNCSSCLSSSYCMGCLSGFYLRDDNLCYSSCPNRTYLINIVCVNCPYSCLTCDGSGKCLSCNSSEFRTLSNGLCLPNTGYYDSQVSVCSKCPDGCASCLNYATCDTCKQGYYFENSQCTQCPSNCQQCVNANSCNVCNTDYSLNSGTCKISQTAASESSSGMPIGILMGAGIGGVLAWIIFFIRQKCSKKQSKGVPIKHEQPLQSMTQIKSQDLQAESSQNQWHDRARSISAQQDCSICLMQQSFFKTSCGHSFHLMCIMEWLKKRDNCPNCRELMTKGKHKVYCRKCHLKYKIIKLDKMKEMTSARRQEAETICEDCKLVPI